MQTATVTTTLNHTPHSMTQNPSARISSGCGECNRRNICLADGLDEEALTAFDSIVKHSKKINRGEYLYQSGEKFHSVFTIRSGSLMTSIIDEEGREQILGFAIQGDVIALDGANLNVYPTSAQALETSYVCEIPFGRYMELAVEVPSLYRQLLSSMGQQIRMDEEHALLLGTKNAEQRLATLLINFADRYSARGFSRNQYNLHMSRRDIGNYISAAMETVSRLFSRLQAMKLINVQGKFIEIKDYDGLKRFAM